jgi:protein involved in polysaccharide export with SLBB domain
MMGTAAGQEETPQGLEQMQVIQQEPYVPPYQVQVQGTALEGIIELEDYTVGPGDRFILSIMRVDPYLEIVTVSPSGMIILPALGTLSVKGQTAAETIESILNLAQRSLPRYEATCTLYGIREIRVSLTGAVRKPGFYTMTPMSRLTDLFQEAGGLQSNAAQHKIELHRGSDDPIILEVNKYYFEGDLEQNPRLAGGDQFIVPFSDIAEDYIRYGGLAPSSRYYPLKFGKNLASVMNRTNFGEGADVNNVIVERTSGTKDQEQLHIASKDYQSFVLEPGDVIYVNKIPRVSVIGEINRPGQYNYQPGMTAGDYIILAGGISKDGSARSAIVKKADGEVRRGKNIQVDPGDSVVIPRSFNSVFLGQLGVVQAALTFLNIYLAYLAATRVSGA